MARNRRNESNSQLPILMSAAQMAKVSGIGENTLRRLMADNQIEYLQIGSHRLWRQFGNTTIGIKDLLLAASMRIFILDIRTSEQAEFYPRGVGLSGICC